MKLCVMFLTILTANLVWAGPAVPFDEVEVKTVESEAQSLKRSSRESGYEKLIAPLSQRSSLKETYLNQSFQSTSDLRSHRRVGLGFQTMGTTGLLGAMIELNFRPSDSMVAGYGGGSGYSAFSFQWKHLFLGQKLAPYTQIGYARWSSAPGAGGNLNQTTPSSLGSKFLTSSEKESGKFVADLIAPAIGIEYHLLNGSSAGTGFFGEITLLTRISRPNPAPAGSFGALYYF